MAGMSKTSKSSPEYKALKKVAKLAEECLPWMKAHYQEDPPAKLKEALRKLKEL